MATANKPAEAGKLLTIEEVGEILNGKCLYGVNDLLNPITEMSSFNFCILSRGTLHQLSNRTCKLTDLAVPVNVKDRDIFHITIEEYLQSLITLIEELARLAINSVTLGDYQRPLQISQFVKDLHAGFQILNLKNDSLRRRSDSIKYNVKKIEDVVYDLSLRNLVPK